MATHTIQNQHPITTKALTTKSQGKVLTSLFAKSDKKRNKFTIDDYEFISVRLLLTKSIAVQKKNHYNQCYVILLYSESMSCLKKISNENVLNNLLNNNSFTLEERDFLEMCVSLLLKYIRYEVYITWTNCTAISVFKLTLVKKYQVKSLIYYSTSTNIYE